MKPGRRPRLVADRFWEKVQPAGPTKCWLWTAGLNHAGYGKFKLTRYVTMLAHRWAYEYLRAPIPEGLTIDHLCRVRNCVNPWHMEPVPIGVNRFRARGTHCKRGLHLLDVSGEIGTDGKRRCGDCRRLRRMQVRAA